MLFGGKNKKDIQCLLLWEAKLEINEEYVIAWRAMGRLLGERWVLLFLTM